MTEEAKAVTAVAKATGKAIDASTALGGFVGRVLGTLPQDAVGLLGDWVSHLRMRNAHRLQLRTDEILASRNAVIEPLSLAVARPLLEAAQDESREELVELWARLLANAMDLSRPPIRRTFIETLRQFDPLDALIMEKTDKESRHSHVPHGDWPTILGIGTDEMMVSLQHLHRLDCLDQVHEPNFQSGMPTTFGHRMSSYGRELMRAVAL